MKDRVALFGLSLGVSIALNLAAYSKDISVSLSLLLSSFSSRLELCIYRVNSDSVIVIVPTLTMCICL
jgi:hypothetical protein